MQYSFVTVASALVATVSASAISTIADGQPQAPSYASAAPTPTSSPVYTPAPPAATTTERVTHLTTVCPTSGTYTYGSHTVTATEETTVTISNCYCDVAKPVPTKAAPVYSAPPAVPTKEVPAVSKPVPVPSSSAVVSQISDNQPQAPTKAAPSAEVPAASAPASVSQIEDNQPQAPTKAAAVPAASAPASVSQIADNQPQAPTSAASVPAASIPAASAPAETPAATPTPPVYTAGAANVAASGFSFAAVLAAVAYVL